MTTQNSKKSLNNAPSVKNPALWVIVEEPQEYLVVNHRLMIDNTGIYGAENLKRVFKTGPEWNAFVQGILSQDVGNINNITWKREV
jgi:hypothetical protein